MHLESALNLTDALLMRYGNWSDVSVFFNKSQPNLVVADSEHPDRIYFTTSSRHPNTKVDFYIIKPFGALDKVIKAFQPHFEVRLSAKPGLTFVQVALNVNTRKDYDELFDVIDRFITEIRFEIERQ